ncbi:MAG: hypothetical protein LPK45_07230, partial [Bacteroidota bacterium]|nr:hypothetical protein [Bacteroidota bacterium]MDX5469613.1 hypothetical protein [Bacteroidota bacterium]
MKEKSLILDDLSPVDLWGTNNHHQKLLQQRFPNLKIISRGNIVKASGDEKDLERFSEDLAILVEYVRQTGRLSEQKFHELLNTVQASSIFKEEENESSRPATHTKMGEDPVIV